jgi:hypothetical protein
MSLTSSDATTAPAATENGYNPPQLGLVINLVIISTFFFSNESMRREYQKMYDVAQYFLEVESVSKLSTHSLSSRQVLFSLSFILFSFSNVETSREEGEESLPMSSRTSRRH